MCTCNGKGREGYYLIIILLYFILIIWPHSFPPPRIPYVTITHLIRVEVWGGRREGVELSLPNGMLPYRTVTAQLSAHPEWSIYVALGEKQLDCFAAMLI